MKNRCTGSAADEWMLKFARPRGLAVALTANSSSSCRVKMSMAVGCHGMTAGRSGTGTEHGHLWLSHGLGLIFARQKEFALNDLVK
jgi:hypothetical protein